MSASRLRTRPGAAVAEDVPTASHQPLRLVARLHVDLLRVASARCRRAR